MSTTVLYSLILAIGQILLALLSFFLGYQTENMAAGRWFSLLPMALSIIVLCLGIRAVREESPDKTMSYGKGVGTGVLISLYAGLLGAAYTYVHLTFINPHFSDYLIETSRAQWAAAGMSGSQMDSLEKGMRIFARPLVQAGVGVLAGVFFGLIVSLIGAAFLKRNPPEDVAIPA